MALKENSLKVLLDRINTIDYFIGNCWKAPKDRLEEMKGRPNFIYLTCYHETLFNLNDQKRIFPCIIGDINDELKESRKIQDLMINRITGTSKDIPNFKNDFNNDFDNFTQFYRCLRILSKYSVYNIELSNILHNFNSKKHFINFLEYQEPLKRKVNSISIALIALTRCLKFKMVQNEIRSSINKGLDFINENSNEDLSSVFLANLVILYNLKIDKENTNIYDNKKLEDFINNIYGEIKKTINNSDNEKGLIRSAEFEPYFGGYQKYIFLIGLKYMKDNQEILEIKINEYELMGIINRLTEIAINDDITIDSRNLNVGESKAFGKCIALTKVKLFYMDWIENNFGFDEQKCTENVLKKIDTINVNLKSIEDKVTKINGKDNDNYINPWIEKSTIVNIINSFISVLSIGAFSAVVVIMIFPGQKDLIISNWVTIATALIGVFAAYIWIFLFRK